MDQQHEWLKVPEVAEILRAACSRAYELVGSGEIPAVKICRSVRVSCKELERWSKASVTRMLPVRKSPSLSYTAQGALLWFSPESFHQSNVLSNSTLRYLRFLLPGR